MNTRQHARSVRARQLFLLIAGVVGTLAIPLLNMGNAHSLILLFALLSALAVPAGYFFFAGALRSAVDDLTGIKGTNNLGLALATIVPLVGSIIEIVLLSTLARDVSRIPGVRDRSGLVVTLGVVRLFVVWLLSPLMAGVVAIAASDPRLQMLAYAAGPLVGFALLGFITQLIVTPILDEVVPDMDIQLRGTGMVGPAAVSSRAPARPQPPLDNQ